VLVIDTLHYHSPEGVACREIRCVTRQDKNRPIMTPFTLRV